MKGLIDNSCKWIKVKLFLNFPEIDRLPWQRLIICCPMSILHDLYVNLNLYFSSISDRTYNNYIYHKVINTQPLYIRIIKDYSMIRLHFTVQTNMKERIYTTCIKFHIQSNLDISKLMGQLFTSLNYPKCKLICTSGNLDL